MNQNIVRIILAGGLAFTSSLGVLAKEGTSNKKEDVIIIEETLDTNKDISLEKAKEIALNKIKGQIMNSYQDDDEYQIIVEKDNKYYEIEVDKITGEIDDIEIKKRKISLEKAKELALKKVNGTIKEIQEEDEYQIIIEKNNDYYEIEIDKETGKIEDIEKEKKKTTLSKKQIKEIALNKITGSIKDIEYDDGDYCVEIIKENNIYEVEIDGQNGNILEIEKDD